MVCVLECSSLIIMHFHTCHLIISLLVIVTIAHRSGAVLYEATPVLRHLWEEGASQTVGSTVVVVTPTAAAGIADMSEVERGSLGAGTPSQNTQHPQVEVGDRSMESL